ncbi:MAG: CPBP family intramembrane glutamic endopeptidase [Candidatus Thorarchaeota archaeon]
MIESKESDYRTIILFMAVSLVIILAYIWLFEIVQSIEAVSGGLIHRTLLLNVPLLIGAIVLVLVVYGGLQAKDFGLVGRKLPLAFVACLLTWVFVQVMEGVASIVGTGSAQFNPIWSTEATVLVGLLIGMLFGTALYEEVGFRGFLLVQFDMKMTDVTSNKYFRITLALLFSQALFTLVHIPWKVMNQGWTVSVFFDLIFSVFMNGLIYGVLYLRTENLFFVMGIHALGNAPTSLFISSIGESNLILLMAIIWAVVWPKLRKWEKEDTVPDN